MSDYVAVLENVPKLQGKDKVEDILKEALKEVIRCPSIILYYSNHQRSFKSFHSFFLSLSLSYSFKLALVWLPYSFMT